MELDRFIHDIHAQLDAAAQAGGEEARELAERLAAPLDSAIRLALQDALAAAAEEITVELAPGSVELRLRGRDPDVADNEVEAEGDGFGCVESRHGKSFWSVLVGVISRG